MAGGLRPRVVAALGPHYQFAVAFGLGFDANRAEAAGGSGIRGLVADGVLILDVARHFPADFIDFIECLGKKRDRRPCVAR